MKLLERLEDRPRTFALLVALAAVAVYANALPNAFVYDDIPQVVDNAWIRDLSNIPEMFRTHVAGFERDQVANYYRPMMHVAYALTYSVFGLAPWAFHLVNVVLHAVASVLVFLLAARLVRAGPDDPTAAVPAFLAGLLFAVHPIHTEAVSWVAGIPDVAYSTMVLAGLVAYLRFDQTPSGPGGRRDRRTWMAYTATLVCFVAAVFTKEPAFALPLVLLVREAAAGGGLRPLRRWLRFLPFAVLGAFYAVARTRALGDFAPLPRHAELSSFEVLLNVPVLYGAYLGKLVWPSGLNAFHVLDPVRSLAEPRAIAGLLATVGFVTAAMWAFLRDRTALVALALIATPLLPVLYIPWLGENSFAERYLYLPSAGFALLVAWFAGRLRARDPGALRGLTVVVVLWSVGLAWATVQRNVVWRDELRLWTDTVAGSPDGVLPRTMLGDVHFERGDLAAAEEQYQAALAIEPRDSAALNNLGLVLLYTGRVPDALRQFERALEVDPRSPQTWNNVGLAHKTAGRYAEAVAAYRRALELYPDHPGLLGNLAQALELDGDPEAAAAVRRRLGQP